MILALIDIISVPVNLVHIQTIRSVKLMDTESAPMNMPTGGLIRPEDFGPLISGRRRGPSVRTRINRLGDTVIDKWKDNWQRPGFRRGAKVSLVVVLLCAAIGAFLALRPRHAPDYLVDDLDDVLDYTLLTADFSKLPLNDRVRLMKQLIERFKIMDGGDSAVLAAFAAGLSKTALEQARQNMEKLTVDLWDDYATQYKDVPVKEREAYLDTAFLEFSKLMEETAGIQRDKPDSERIADARKQAKRDVERAPEPGPMSSATTAPLMKLIQDRGQQVSSPEQRGRMGKFSRDMVRHLRDQNIDTGNPKGDASPAAKAPIRPGSPAAGSDAKPRAKPANPNEPATDGQTEASKETDAEKAAKAKERERLKNERLERERLEKERLERERLEKERLEKERKAKEGK